jgi:glyoxylase-like metal-dependent hydrolase (beta-lactamase superfamily II)
MKYFLFTVIVSCCIIDSYNGGAEMYELIKAAEHSWYIECPAKVGIYVSDETDENGKRRAYLIDTGNDKDCGKKVLKALEKENIALQAVFITHSNADHVGGCRLITGRLGIPAYAPGIESCITENPLMETSYLYGGYPPRDLRHKFLMAQACGCEDLNRHPEALPDGLTVIPMHGHYFDMAGYRTCDGAVYIADCVSSRENLEKYQLWVIYSVPDFLETLKSVMEMEADLFIPSHADATENIRPLALYNIDKVNETADMILSILKEPMVSDELIRRIFREYDLQFSFEQYVLVGSTVRSYLSWLRDEKRADAYIDDCRIMWKAVQD